MARDKFNQEKHEANDGIAARAGNWFKNLPGVKNLRDAIGQKADEKAVKGIYDMTSQGGVEPPKLPEAFVRDKVVVADGDSPANQLQNTSYTFTYPPGSPNAGFPENISGFQLAAQPGKPTVVYFGGSEFDRESESYQKTIKEMAEQARKQGMGFVVFDYPGAANEEVIKAAVDQISAHLEQNGIPKNQQAYAGFSLGGFSAMYAAKQNPEAAGLHVTSTFSSVRQATKDEMKDQLGPLAGLVPKHQLSEIMDNVDLADQIVAQQQQRVNDGKPAMPISMISSQHESFGNANNKHMTPLADRFSDYPDQNKVKISSTDFRVSGDIKDQHLSMPSQLDQMNSFKDFVADARTQSETLQLDQQVNLDVDELATEIEKEELDQVVDELTTEIDKEELDQVVDELATEIDKEELDQVVDELATEIDKEELATEIDKEELDQTVDELATEIEVESPVSLPEVSPKPKVRDMLANHRPKADSNLGPNLEQPDPSSLSVKAKIDKFGGSNKVGASLPLQDKAESTWVAAKPKLK